MPDLKNAFPQLEKVKEWVNFTAFLKHPSQKKRTPQEPHHFLKSDSFKPDTGILVIPAYTINNFRFFNILRVLMKFISAQQHSKQINSMPCSLFFYQNTKLGKQNLLTTFHISNNTC